MLEKFNKQFNISGELKQIELEDALLETFKDFQYTKFSETILDDQVIPKSYTLGVEHEWGCANLFTDINGYKNRKEALMGLFIEHCENTKLQHIIKKVYKGD